MENIKSVLKIIINILVIGVIIFLGINLFVFLLPLLVVIILIYYLYQFFVKRKKRNSFAKNVYSNEPKNSRKNIKNQVEDAEVINEKFD